MTTPVLDKKDIPHFIMNELRSGNSRAFEFIFNEYYASLSRFAYSLIKDQDKAQSLTQEVFIKLWEKRLSVVEIDNLLGYLMTMVRNQCVDYLRKEKANAKTHLKVQSEESGNTTEEEVSKNEFEASLLKALQKLPARCRMAFEMSRFDSFSNKEIALKMDISVKGVEALIGRSLKLLRTDLIEFLPSASDNKRKGNGSILLSFFINRWSGRVTR
ncbi:MAG TPA: RNA polymerase sigma-70 factor [Prolixibacteraceae bacterium]|nr:RNA polymerase sigma-70 factor [Prolixibacteraceae bacterium]